MTVYPNPTITVDESGELPERHVCIHVVADGEEIATVYLAVGAALTIAADICSRAQSVNRQIAAWRVEQRLRKDGLI